MRSNKNINQIDLSLVVQRLTRAIQKAYQDKPMQLQLPQQPCWVALAEGDAMELFGNIIDNAFKYGGDVLKIEFEQTGKQLLVRIEDNGEGVDKRIIK